MAFGGFDRHNTGGRAMAEINMIPLIDVMLVLLVIFMVAAPMMTHTVKIDLPKTGSLPQQTNHAEPINLAIAADGKAFWNRDPVDRQQLRQKLSELAREPDAPELHIRADKTAPYRFIAETMADAAQAGVVRIGFVSEPDNSH